MRELSMSLCLSLGLVFLAAHPASGICEEIAGGEPFDVETDRTEDGTWTFQVPIAGSPGYCYLVTMTSFEITYDVLQTFLERCLCENTGQWEQRSTYEKIVASGLTRREVQEKSRVKVECCEGTPPTCPIGQNGAPQPQNPGIASGSLCRGACGPDCPATCRQDPDIAVCLPAGDCHYICTYSGIVTCGSHQGCRDHDACYDACATSSWPAVCRRGCDLQCISDHGISNCNSWMRGGGPFDSWITFSNPPALTGPFPGPCPA